MNLADAQKALDAALAEHAESQETLRSATGRNTAAVNKLNEAQKAFDAAVAAIRAGGSVYGTDWARQPAKAIER